MTDRVLFFQLAEIFCQRKYMTKKTFQKSKRLLKTCNGFSGIFLQCEVRLQENNKCERGEGVHICNRIGFFVVILLFYVYCFLPQIN
jgi:hypothetical protein